MNFEEINERLKLIKNSKTIIKKRFKKASEYKLEKLTGEDDVTGKARKD